MTIAPPQPQITTGFDHSMIENPPRQPAKLAKRPLVPPQALKIRDVDIIVLEDRCKGCSFCVEFCPRDVLERGTKLNVRGAHVPQVSNPDLCVGCGVCEDICPDFAIFLVDKGERR